MRKATSKEVDIIKLLDLKPARHSLIYSNERIDDIVERFKKQPPVKDNIYIVRKFVGGAFKLLFYKKSDFC